MADLPESDLRRIEEASLRAWPAEQQLLYDGWVVRISGGYTKRANSAVLLYPQPDSTSSPVLNTIEQEYHRRDMPAVFRLLSFTASPELDRRFETRGYRPADTTWVMALSLDAPLEPDMAVCSLDLEEGLQAHARMNELPADKLRAHRAILERISNGLSFAGIREHSEVVACGCSVVDGGLAGLFDIVTAPDRRRNGYARRLVRAMLARAQSRGATMAYLQVIGANEPAIALYRSLGFEVVSSYRYWILDRSCRIRRPGPARQHVRFRSLREP